jgi:hypothetical protein
MKTYDVTARKSGHWWVLQAERAPGAISQVRKLSEATVIREAIAWIDGIAEDEIEIRLVPHVDAEVDPLLAKYQAVTRQARQLEEERAGLQRSLARGLTSHGINYRDTGQLLDVSYQRVGQLVKQ